MFRTILGFTHYEDHKPTNAIDADRPGVFASVKILNLSTKDKIYLKCDVIDGSVVDGLKHSMLFGFVLYKPSVYKVFCELETLHYKKINKLVLNTNSFLFRI